MRTTFAIVTNSFANGYIRESVFNIASEATRAISTESYFKHGFPQRQCAGIRCPRFMCAAEFPRKFAGVVVEKLKLDWSVVDCRKVFTVFHTATVY